MVDSSRYGSDEKTPCPRLTTGSPSISEGTTIVLVSHSLGQVEQLCDRCIWIHDGIIREEGKPRDVDPMYLDFLSGKMSKKKTREGSNGEDMEQHVIRQLR